METESQTILIEPARRLELFSVAEIWRYRELLYFLTWRDIKVRYKQTAIGAAWAVLQPFLTMVVFTVLFGNLIQVSSDGVPYPVFAFAALLPWTFFASALNRASNSLIYDANLISKIYFPRLLLPFAAALSVALDFAIAFVILLAMMLFYGIVPGIAVLTLPLFLLPALATALGCGLWLAALNVKYRDIGYVVPFLTQFWLFITPVAYSSAIIPETWRTLYGLNPMSGVVEGFRWALLGTARVPAELYFISTAVVVALLLGGLLYFRRMEDEFADVV
ncbi:MAG: ABC transporter permease [Chloroflexi bacterium]|nr:ABC transporter permease [Chloroflexota bacterium]